MLHHRIVELHGARGFSVDFPIAVERWILIDPAAHFRKPYFGGGMSIDTKQAVLHGHTETYGACSKSKGFAKGHIDLGQIAAQHRLTGFHLFVSFAGIAGAQTGHAQTITAS